MKKKRTNIHAKRYERKGEKAHQKQQQCRIVKNIGIKGKFAFITTSFQPNPFGKMLKFWDGGHLC